MFKAARCQVDFTLYVHEDMAKIVKKHDIWDLMYEETQRVILISPGTHRRRHGNTKDGYSKARSGCSTVDFKREPAGWRQGLRFNGMDQRDPIPLFGRIDVNPKIDDDESMTIQLPSAHLLPWIAPFRATAWTQQDVMDYIRQRMDAAIRSGLDPKGALAAIHIPEIYKHYIEPDTWKKFIGTYVPDAFNKEKKS